MLMLESSVYISYTISSDTQMFIVHYLLSAFFVALGMREKVANQVEFPDWNTSSTIYTLCMPVPWWCLHTCR
jgi:hypothetical protein